MLPTLLCLALSATGLGPQGPSARADARVSGSAVAVAPSGGAGSSEGIEVVGPVELSRAEAIATAKARAVDEWQRRTAVLADAVAARDAEPWLPSFVRRAAVRRWTARHSRPRIARTEVVTREHGFGPSYQARLELVAEADALLAAPQRRSLRGALDAAAARFVSACVATLLSWILAAAGFLWFDRLSRGYMTGRLGLLFTLAGLAVPTIALFLLAA